MIAKKNSAVVTRLLRALNRTAGRRYYTFIRYTKPFYHFRSRSGIDAFLKRTAFVFTKQRKSLA